MHFSKRFWIIASATIVVIAVLIAAAILCKPKHYSIEVAMNGTPDDKAFAILTSHDITPLDTFLTWQSYAEYWAFMSYYLPLVQDHPELFGDSSAIAEFYSAAEDFLSDTHFTAETFEQLGADADACLNQIYLDNKDCDIYYADSTGVITFKLFPWNVKKKNVIVITSAELYDYLITKRCPTNCAFDVTPLSTMNEKEQFFVGEDPNIGAESVVMDNNETDDLTHEEIDWEVLRGDVQ